MRRDSTLVGVANARLVIIEKVKICLNRKAFIFLLWITILAVSSIRLLLHLHPMRCSSFSCKVEPDTHSTWRCSQVVRLRAQPQMLHKWILSIAHEVEIPLSGFREPTSCFCSPPALVLQHVRGGPTPALSLECGSLICGTLWAWEKTLRVDSRSLQTDTLGWSGIPEAD